MCQHFAIGPHIELPARLTELPLGIKPDTTQTIVRRSLLAQPAVELLNRSVKSTQVPETPPARDFRWVIAVGPFWSGREHPYPKYRHSGITGALNPNTQNAKRRTILRADTNQTKSIDIKHYVLVLCTSIQANFTRRVPYKPGSKGLEHPTACSTCWCVVCRCCVCGMLAVHHNLVLRADNVAEKNQWVARLRMHTRGAKDPKDAPPLRPPSRRAGRRPQTRRRRMRRRTRLRRRTER